MEEREVDYTLMEPESSELSYFTENKMDREESKDEGENNVRFLVTDFITNIHEATRVSISLANQQRVRLSRYQKLIRSLHIFNPSVWVLLAVLGVLSALVGFSVDYLASKLLELRLFLTSDFSFWLSLGIWVVYGVALVLVGTVCSHLISQDSQGSGIPEMKSILAGVNIFKYLSFNTMAAKVVGLTAVSGAGLSVGKEGPFVHISAILAHRLCKALPGFNHILENATLHTQILAAAVATGVCATFGAPMGGVLFSIEVTATYYVVNNLWKAFYGAVWCSVMFSLLAQIKVVDLIQVNNYAYIPFNWQVLSFALLGLVSGALGAGFVWASKHILTFRKNQKLGFLSYRYFYSVTVSVVCSLITFSHPFFQLSDKAIITELFHSDPLHEQKSGWSDPDLFLNLSVYTAAKLFMTTISITSPVPCGVFTPVFTAGAAFGRLWGNLMWLVFGVHYQGVYALVGAATFASSVTHTISVAVIVFELTGQLHYMTYMLVGVLLSFAVGNALGTSIYDVMLFIKGLPYMPALKPSRIYKRKAKHVMSEEFGCLRSYTSIKDLINIYKKNVEVMHRIPILDEEDFLIADLNINSIRKYLNKSFESAKESISSPHREKLYSYFRRLYKIQGDSYVRVT